jgi:hypothetical protein
MLYLELCSQLQENDFHSHERTQTGFGVIVITRASNSRSYSNPWLLIFKGGSALMTWNSQAESDGREFVEFRRKVRSAEILSAAMERLLKVLQFSGKLSVVVQNGRVLKSGYEEGYFRVNSSGEA